MMAGTWLGLLADRLAHWHGVPSAAAALPQSAGALAGQANGIATGSCHRAYSHGRRDAG